MRASVVSAAIAGALVMALPGLAATPSGDPARRPPDPSSLRVVEAAALLASSHRVEPDVTYLALPTWSGKLDLYLPRRPAGPLPTAILFHGGGWVTGSKDEIALDVLPYVAMGFAVVNVDYRLAAVARAPAAVEDARCALRWVVRHASEYGLDADRIVLVGSSAGGHLALMAAFAPPSAGFDGACPGDDPMPVAAVINFFGISDVAQLLAPPRVRDFAEGWLGGHGAAEIKLAQRLSPLTYVRKDVPPVLTFHGDSDPVVPFDQAVRLHDALRAAGVPNQLVQIRGGRHGEFDGEQVLKATDTVRAFLLKRHIIARVPSPGSGSR